ncbi:MAG: P-II family nitrogen regulator [Candidatus Scalindua sp. AMX11]|nr:MAG: P-II family nitrogen regulator [Candidatus Scalindua sp.]NOG83278.1 P-II family nitrogen regulator [Planctomycetota bacterium]RZV71960.1 MAG: P-II family nitrogen regulator [Candidatus Scalindua sp. SCAELEC01]TDE63602.1 MAG: P-II family nitrogen regulator [Candidatus Scalindua sp. AMX11]GJQ60048.1 MAG: nitrogen regulatory protein P-II [Candidatus Scalindua sp.]
MKLVKVILRPEKTFELKDVLYGLGYHGITAKQTTGFGEQKKTIKQVYRGRVYEQRVDSVKREELEFVVPDDKIEKVIETIRNVAKTQEGGDGRVYVIPLEDSIHIHSGDKHLGNPSEKELESDEIH